MTYLKRFGGYFQIPSGKGAARPTARIVISTPIHHDPACTSAVIGTIRPGYDKLKKLQVGV